MTSERLCNWHSDEGVVGSGNAIGIVGKGAKVRGFNTGVGAGSGLIPLLGGRNDGEGGVTVGMENEKSPSPHNSKSPQ